MCHLLRISAVERGVSNMNAAYERRFLEESGIQDRIDSLAKQMIALGREVGPVWDWMQGIKGLKSGKLAAQLLAQIDDISTFTNVSKLWRFCGFAVIDGEREYRKGGEAAHYNARLKSTCFLIADQFIKQRTPGYREIYDAEKARLRQEHPEPEPDDRRGSPFKMRWTDQHIHAMAMRKMVKIFLQHLWLVWRESEGLPTNQPYAIAILGHADYVLPAVEITSEI